MISSALKMVAGALIGLAILAVSAYAFTVVSSTLNLHLNSEAIQTDASSVVTLTGINVASASAAGTGAAPGTALEASPANPSLNNAMTAGDLLYTFTVTEAAAGSWDAATTYKVQIYGDNVLMTTLYFENATADAGNVEGVAVNVDVGSATVMPDHFVVQTVKTS
jgi:hypothetical protein